MSCDSLSGERMVNTRVHTWEGVIAKPKPCSFTWTKVVLPDPAIPKHIIHVGLLSLSGFLLSPVPTPAFERAVK